MSWALDWPCAYQVRSSRVGRGMLLLDVVQTCRREPGRHGQGMQQNPMHTVADTVAVQQVNPRKMDPAGSSVSQI